MNLIKLDTFLAVLVALYLTMHKKACKGNASLFICEQCDGIFASKKTLKVHKKSCNQKTCYSCSECCKQFTTLKRKDDHRRKFHTKIHCDFCKLEITHAHNLKRCIKIKHKDLTPAKAKELEKQLLLTSEHEFSSKFKCDDCNKYFHDKSTLIVYFSSNWFSPLFLLTLKPPVLLKHRKVNRLFSTVFYSRSHIFLQTSLFFFSCFWLIKVF
jgi:hypothetical protein